MTIRQATKRLYSTDRNNRSKKRITKNATIRNSHISPEIDKK